VTFDMFNRLDLVERAGSGINRIKGAVRERGLKVRFDTDEFFTVIFPDQPEHHFSLAYSYEMKGKHVEAILELKEVIRLDPRNADACRMLGSILIDGGKIR
jgi:predicted HTH transcriptional regulator